MSTADDFMALVQRKESLCPELRAYLERPRKKGDWPMLRHPLVYAVPYTAQMNALYNAQFKDRKERTEEKMKAKDYEGYVWMHERPYRLNAFIEVMRVIAPSPRRYGELLVEIHRDTENLSQNLSTWLMLWEEAERIGALGATMTTEERDALAALPATVTIYRGTDGRGWRGLSWTLDRNRAIWFANRFKAHRVGYCWKAEVRKADIYAFTNGRSENEIIVSPSKVKIHSHESV